MNAAVLVLAAALAPEQQPGQPTALPLGQPQSFLVVVYPIGPAVPPPTQRRDIPPVDTRPFVRETGRPHVTELVYRDDDPDDPLSVCLRRFRGGPPTSTYGGYAYDPRFGGYDPRFAYQGGYSLPAGYDLGGYSFAPPSYGGYSYRDGPRFELDLRIGRQRAYSGGYGVGPFAEYGGYYRPFVPAETYAYDYGGVPYGYGNGYGYAAPYANGGGYAPPYGYAGGNGFGGPPYGYGASGGSPY